MGIVTLALITDGHLSKNATPPLWVIAMCGIAIALGTYLGGWRVIRTVGHRLTNIEPPQGFCAETASAAVLLISTHGGAPLSTTQITTGSVIGSGVGKRAAGVHWGVAGRMVMAWVVTIPAAAVVAGVVGLATHNGNAVGVTLVTILAALGLIGVWVHSRRNPVNADNVNDESESTDRQLAGASA
jgi:PiT family inorganic phosphate transporter